MQNLHRPTDANSLNEATPLLLHARLRALIATPKDDYKRVGKVLCGANLTNI